jgi:DNA repair protein RadC
MPFSVDKVDMPREKLAQKGAAALKDAELLAIILGTGYKGKNVLDLSKEILKNYPAPVLVSMSVSELQKIKGIGAAKASIIAASAELAVRGRAPNPSSIQKPTDLLPLAAEIRSKKKEHFVAFYLNARNEVIHREFVSIGTLSASLVHPREVFKSAIEHSAAGVIFTHNHPSNDPVPSDEDIKLTKRLVSAGLILGIEVLDHIIVTETDFTSMKGAGLM